MGSFFDKKRGIIEKVVGDKQDLHNCSSDCTPDECWPEQRCWPEERPAPCWPDECYPNGH